MSSTKVDSTAEWSRAINCAEAELQRNLRRVRQLRRAIRLLKQNREDGLELPKTQKQAQNM